MKVFNNTNRSLQVARWTLLPKSTKCVNQFGNTREELPDDVAYGSVVKRLEKQGAVTLPSFGKVGEKHDTPSKESPRAPLPTITPQEYIHNKGRRAKKSTLKEEG